MRGSLVRRGKNRWALVFDRWVIIDPTTGARKRKQKWVSFRGNKEEAARELTAHVNAVNKNEFVEPTKVTVGKWLTEWLEKSVKAGKRPRTYRTYQSVIASGLAPALGAIQLQALKPLDVQNYYATHAGLSAGTVRLHHAVLSAALKSAVKNGMITRNVAALADGKPRIEHSADDLNCLNVDEARALLAAAKAAGPRRAAFYALGLDSGARLGELCGLKWTDLDLDASKMTIVRQLADSKLAEDGTAAFGPPKTGRSRRIDLGPETVVLLREHRRAQAELKMKNRASYRDLGLVFAKEEGDLCEANARLGDPLQVRYIGSGDFQKLLKAANVKRITFHGLRHTSATLLLLNGESAKVVAERLGHSKIGITLDLYSHVLPSMGRGAADRLGTLLHG